MDRQAQAGFSIILLLLANLLTIESVDYFGYLHPTVGDPWYIMCDGLRWQDEVKWTRNGVSLKPEIVSQELTVYTNGTASTISAAVAKPSHQGEYKCNSEFPSSYYLQVENGGESRNVALAWLSIIPLLVFCMLVVFIWQRNRKRTPREPSYVEPNPPSLITASRQQEQPSYLEFLTTTATNDSMELYTAINFTPAESKAAEDQPTAHLYAVPNDSNSRSVSTQYFEEYVKKAAASGLLNAQFMLLPSGLTWPCNYGRLPENMPKNRVKHLIAYDDTRVVLKKIPGDPYSDYINASYIQGYKKERAYIAAQGPKPNTVNDFWRMIWQEEVRVICMLTDVIEGTETKCEKYWPDLLTSSKYGDLHVLNMDQQIFADYTYSTFKLSFRKKIREVTHLHFTGWPSLGVPTCIHPLVTFLKYLRETPTGNGPLVVHCSAGDDRTGTLILADICLRQAAREQVIDVVAVTSRIRTCRANMVGTVQQYQLAHIIIVESMVSSSTRIPCNEVLGKGMKKMRMHLLSDAQTLKDTAWQVEALNLLAVRKPSSTSKKDRLTELGAGDAEVTLFDHVETTNNPLNAVSVDSVRVKNQYLTCCLPSPFNLSNFWAFVVEKDIKLMIILQCSDPKRPTCRDIMPDESIIVPSPQIRVKDETPLHEREYFTNEELLLTDASEEEKTQSVTVLTCKEWARGENGQPPPPAALISLWRAAGRIPRKEFQTLVLCHDGITGCGLYLALSLVLERMNVEKVCDVISAVRTVRCARPEYVQSLEHFDYLYDVAVNYMEHFQTYDDILVQK